MVNLISFKMIIQENDLENLNKNLPKDIRVYKIQRVTKFFNPKNMCEGRKYEYIIPTFCFKNQKEKEEKEEVDLTKFRINQQEEERIEKYLKHFEGTLNYHNFTKFMDSNKKLEQFKSNRLFHSIIFNFFEFQKDILRHLKLKRNLKWEILNSFQLQ